MRNNRRAGKPAGRKPEKQGLTGLFTKGKNIPTTAQQTLPYREMYRDGVCRVADRYYTKTIEYEDINYQLAQSEDQAAIFDGWSACLNYFDSSLPFQLSFLNHRSRPGSRYSVNIPMQDDDYNSVRCEYVEMLENQIAKSNNGIVRTKLLTFGAVPVSVRWSEQTGTEHHPTRTAVLRHPAPPALPHGCGGRSPDGSGCPALLCPQGWQ